MRRLHVWFSTAAAISLMACATTADEDPTGVTEPELTGLTASGAVIEIVTTTATRQLPNIQFNVKVTLANQATSSASLTYRTSCPVRLQLFAGDGRKVYDESGRECGSGLSTISVGSREEQSLFSGVRFPTTVLGDSLTAGRYRVVAVVQRDGSPLSVEAGNYNIPLCQEGCRVVVPGAGASK